MGNNHNTCIDKGKEFAEKYQFEEAIKCFDRAIELERDSFEAYINKAHAKTNQGSFNDAIECYDRAILIDPKNSLAFNAKGKVLSKLNENQLALKCYDMALELNPEYLDALNNKGTTLNNMNKNEEAKECFLKVIESDIKNSYAYNGMAKIFYELNNYEESVTYYNLAIEFHPNYFVYHCNKGYSLLGLNLFADSLKSFSSAILLNPKDSDSYSGKGFCLLHKNNLIEALEIFDTALELNLDDAYSYAGKGRVLYNLNRYDAALLCFDKAIELDKNMVTAYNDKAQLLLDLNRNLEAFECWEKATKLNLLRSSSDYRNLGISYLKIKNYFQCNSTFEKSLKMNPNDYECLFYRAVFNFENDNFEESTKILEKVIEMNPLFVNSYYYLGECMRKKNKPFEAYDYYDKCHEINEYFSDSYFRKALILLESSNFKYSLEEIDKAIKYNPFKQEYVKTKDVILTKINLQDDNNKSLSSQCNSISIQNSNTQLLSTHYESRIQNEEKMTMAEKIENSPNPDTVLTQYGDLETDLKKLNLSISDFKIEMKDIEFVYENKKKKVLGSGNFGIIYLCKIHNIEYAVKKIPMSEDNEKLIKDEIKVLFMMKNPYINGLIHWTEDDEAIYLVMECFKEGDLSKYLSRNKGLITNEKKILFLNQIASALLILHSKNIQHNDIKCSNILVANENRVVLGDFGMSLQHTSTVRRSNMSIRGTSGFIAPEIMKENKPNLKSDIYSFGLLIWELFSEEFPFSGLNYESVKEKVVGGERPDISLIEKIPAIKKELIDLIQHCWKQNPDERPTILEVIHLLSKV